MYMYMYMYTVYSYSLDLYWKETSRGLLRSSVSWLIKGTPLVNRYIHAYTVYMYFVSSRSVIIRNVIPLLQGLGFMYSTGIGVNSSQAKVIYM